LENPSVSQVQTIKAAVCYEFDEPLVVQEIEIDPPQAGEVKVRVAACAICHSDIHWIRGEWGAETPAVVGHEVAGTITEVGPGVINAQPGDRVVVSLLRACGRCFYCTVGSPNNCTAEFPLDRESRLRNKQGVTLAHGLYTAGFAEYTVVDQSQVIKIPEQVDFDCACLLACGVVTGLGAVVNTARVEVGSSVVVIGVGGVGLNCVQGAALAGAAKIIAIDLLDNKLEAARLFGATHTVNATQQDPAAAVLALTEGRGADYALAAVGSSQVITQACQMIRPGGTAVVVGMPANDDVKFTLNAHHLVYDRTVTGSFMGSTRLSVDVPRLVALYQQGRLKLDELITGRYPLERINEAIELMERGEALRNVILF
jgi:S-(hydroxymethyl)glutathione dehydrogenase/alcohol dehydrogenase